MKKLAINNEYYNIPVFLLKNRQSILFVILFLLPSFLLCAQRILYSPFVNDPSAIRFEVIGKSGEYYWVHKIKRSRILKKAPLSWSNGKELSFEIYDARMNRTKTFSYPVSDTVLKEYLIAGNDAFDQLQLINANDKTNLLLNRYSPEGKAIFLKDTLAVFPGNMKGNDFLLLRSEDKNKMLLLCFESVTDEPLRLHAILYNTDWKVLYQTIYKDRNLAQPFTQYEFINYPLEHFDNSPVKLANNGDWLMVAPSRRNANYALFHFHGADSSFVSNEIRVAQSTGVQNVSLSLDNEKGEASAGILLNTRYPSVKKVRIAHYLFTQCHFDFDTTYRFNTLAANKIKEENLYEQYFIPVPSKGFMLLKEYGRTDVLTDLNNEVRKMNTSGDDTDMVVSPVPGNFNKDDYTRYNNLAGIRNKYDRGDLSLYYFPATHNDTCWSGIINKQQTAELNSSYLSYVFMPVEDKLIFLYNSLFRNDNPYSSTTILDQNGQPLNEGLVFWKSNNVFDFQKARQISARELAVPYERNRLQGFAVIRL